MARTVGTSTKAGARNATDKKAAGSKSAKTATRTRIERSAGDIAAEGLAMSRTFLTVLADQLAEEVRSGAALALPDLMLEVVTLDGAPEILFDLLAEEGRKKRRNDDRCTALLMLIGGALGELRMAVEAERGGPAALTLMGLLERLVDAAEEGTLPSDLLLGLGQQFVSARLPLPDDVRELIVTAAGAPMKGVPVPTPESMAASFAEAAEAMDHDPFLIHEQFGEQVSLFPDEVRVSAVGTMIDSDVPALREAGLGWLLDPNPNVARAVAERLAAAAERGLVSAASADRLVRMRPWLPEPVQEPVAAAIAACRQRGAGPLPADAAAPARSVRFIATGCDGGGAQSVFALVDRPDRHDFAALLMKHGHGLREVVLQEETEREQSTLFLKGMSQTIDCLDTSPDVVRDLIAHGLAAGLAAGEPPPFELLRFLDLVGLPPIAPAHLEPGHIVAQLLDGLPEERRSEAATRAALAASQGWAKAFHFPGSWFEADAMKVTIAALTAGRKRQGAVLTRIVEPQRAYFGEWLAWIAKAVQGGAAMDGAGAPVKVGRGRRKLPAADAWIDFALVARAFLDGTPIEEIPLAAEIARQTLAVQRSR